MGFLAGKKILIAGLLSNRSIAYGIAAAMKREGAELAFTYQMEKHEGRVAGLAAEFDSKLVFHCDVAEDTLIDALFPAIAKHWDGIDSIVHSVAFVTSHGLRMFVLREQMRVRAKERRAGSTAPPPVPEVPAASSAEINGEPWGEPADVVTIVSGLPRSGTSMMMQMLAAGGVPIYSDDRRVADADNPLGYFEHDLAPKLASNDKWLPQVRGRAVKIVAPLLPRLPDKERYAIVMMHRDLGEVVASQREMLKRLGRKGAALCDDELTAALRREMARVQRWIARRDNVRVLDIQYATVLADPEAAAGRIAAFLNRSLDLPAMADAVKPALRRQTHQT